jgi:hypothetical protein
MSLDYAYIIDGVVQNIVVADASWVDEQEDKENYIQYSELNYAFINGPYIDGWFYEPQPYQSWSLNTVIKQWQAPIDKPIDSKKWWDWDENSQSWIENSNFVWNEVEQHFSIAED